MNTFLKTFIICLILCIGFIGYKCFNEDSYSPDMFTKNKDSIYSMQKPQNNLPVEDEKPKEEQPKDDSKQYSYTCYFYSSMGKLEPLKRKTDTEMSLEAVVTLLLKGPIISENRLGYHSEIPIGTNLIDIKKSDKKIIVNLTSKFGDGGGSQSIENRVKQLSKTVKAIEPNKNIYLYIDGKEVEYLGGDGVYIKQPI